MARLVNDGGIICLFNDDGDLVASGQGSEEFADDLFNADEYDWAERILGHNNIVIDVSPFDIKEIHEQIKIHQVNDSPTEEAMRENFYNEYN